MTKTEMIGKLRAAGWRVRDGGWPATRAGTAIRQADDLQCLLKGEKDMICTREERARPRTEAR